MNAPDVMSAVLCVVAFQTFKKTFDSPIPAKRARRASTRGSSGARAAHVATRTRIASS